MPQADLHYSGDLPLDALAMLVILEKVIAAHDASASGKAAHSAVSAGSRRLRFKHRNRLSWTPLQFGTQRLNRGV